MRVRVLVSISVLVISVVVAVMNGCNFLKLHASFQDGSADSSSSGVTIVAGIGATLSGTGALSMPTGNATIQRLVNGLGTNAAGAPLVSPFRGNFEATLNQVNTNLANATDPTQFSGGDANMLLAYSACADAGNVSLYGIGSSGTGAVAANQAKLVAAGITILDRYLGHLASQGPAYPALQSAFNQIVSNSINNGVTNDTSAAFQTVCMAANTAGTTLLGF